MNNPPEGITSEDIRHMREDNLPDMDYLLNEDDPFEEDFGEEGPSDLYTLNTYLSNICFSLCLKRSEFLIKKEAAALFLHAPASPLLLVSYQILIH